MGETSDGTKATGDMLSEAEIEAIRVELATFYTRPHRRAEIALRLLAHVDAITAELARVHERMNDVTNERNGLWKAMGDAHDYINPALPYGFDWAIMSTGHWGIFLADTTIEIAEAWADGRWNVHRSNGDETIVDSGVAVPRDGEPLLHAARRCVLDGARRAGLFDAQAIATTEHVARLTAERDAARADGTREEREARDARVSLAFNQGKQVGEHQCLQWMDGNFERSAADKYRKHRAEIDRLDAEIAARARGDR